MNCPYPDEVHRCDSEPPPAALEDTPRKVRTGDSVELQPEALGDDSAWRAELAARLQRYRTRRKMRPPRYPSLRLDFNASGQSENEDDQSASQFDPLMNQALALDGRVAIRPGVEMAQPEQPEHDPAFVSGSGPGPTGAKIIEFPRFAWAPPPPPPDQLAEPVCERPRILDVPEVAPPPPALGGITIEPAVTPELEKRPGIDFPLHCASLSRRLAAGVVDGLLVTAATAIFGSIFWKLTATTPPRVQVLGLAVGLSFLFWATYHYLLIVYTGRTPGLMAAGLELARFDGSGTSRSLRRWRVLTSYLSAASLGMGYAWVFLDEDALCWHDRMTHTHLAPKKKPKDD